MRRAGHGYNRGTTLLRVPFQVGVSLERDCVLFTDTTKLKENPVRNMHEHCDNVPSMQQRSKSKAKSSRQVGVQVLS